MQHQTNNETAKNEQKEITKGMYRGVKISVKILDRIIIGAVFTLFIIFLICIK